jgi:hypothetical protein
MGDEAVGTIIVFGARNKHNLAREFSRDSNKPLLAREFSRDSKILQAKIWVVEV